MQLKNSAMCWQKANLFTKQNLQVRYALGAHHDVKVVMENIIPAHCHLNVTL